MLTYEDEPTIRHAMMKRLDREPGVEICEIKIVKLRDCISVGVLAVISHGPQFRSLFHLPLSFELRHVHNEIDEIAEQYKKGRAEFFRQAHFGQQYVPDQWLLGTGLRGRWAKYG
jgi:hypothetical protein